MLWRLIVKPAATLFFGGWVAKAVEESPLAQFVVGLVTLLIFLGLFFDVARSFNEAFR